MPADVTDLRDVVDAINKLCDDMKTSYVEETFEDCQEVEERVHNTRNVEGLSCFETVGARILGTVQNVEEFSRGEIEEILEVEVEQKVKAEENTIVEEMYTIKEYRQLGVILNEVQTEDRMEISPEEIMHKAEANIERWSDSQVSYGQVEDLEAITSDTEPAMAQCEAISEYYTASSEVSLLSDELQDKARDEDEETKDGKECVIAGHVAAMRERFESMTRTNTPCPDLIRSSSPSLDVFRNITPSPDRLG